MGFTVGFYLHNGLLLEHMHTCRLPEASVLAVHQQQDTLKHAGVCLEHLALALVCSMEASHAVQQQLGDTDWLLQSAAPLVNCKLGVKLCECRQKQAKAASACTKAGVPVKSAIKVCHGNKKSSIRPQKQCTPVYLVSMILTVIAA